MIRKRIVPLSIAAAATLAPFVSLLLTPVTSHVRAESSTPTPTMVSGDSGSSGGGNTGG